VLLLLLLRLLARVVTVASPVCGTGQPGSVAMLRQETRVEVR